jgi:hypothetical protein
VSLPVHRAPASPFPRQALPCFSGTMNWSDSLSVVCTILPFIGLIGHTPERRTPQGLPSFHNIRLIPCHGLGPRRARIALPCPNKTIGDESTAFRQNDNVGLRDNKYFVAESLHLRCGPVSPPPGFTTACYQTGCRVQF